MNLKYQLYETTSLEPEIIKDRVLKLLEGRHYIITDRKENVITFKDDKWEFRQKTDLYKKVDKGRFEFNIPEKSNIKLTYSITFVPQLVMGLAITFIISNLVSTVVQS